MSRFKSTQRRSSEIHTDNDTHNFTLSQYSLQASQGQEDGDGFRVLFVLLDGQTEETCSPALSETYKLCRTHTVSCSWIPESKVLNTIPSASNVFVLPEFVGPVYNYLEEQFFAHNYFMIIGPQCLRYIFHRNEDEILHRGYPMLTLGMKNIVVTLTGFKDKSVTEQLTKLIQKMGGVATNLYTMATTHLVTDNVLSDKCAAAYANKRPVMTAEWVHQVWKESQTIPVHATDKRFIGLECPLFYKLKICMSQVPNSAKGLLRKIIEDNGGSYSPDLIRRQIDILLLERGEGDKFRHSMQWGIPCISPEWIHASEAAGHVLPFTEFLVSGSDHPLSSTPTDSRKVKLPDMTTCSIISPLDSSVVHATISSRESVMSDYNRDVIENGGNFLDGCRVYICGCDNLAQAKKLLNGSGSTRLDRLTDNVSHVIVLGPRIPDKDVQTLKRFHNMPYIVGMEWLTESARNGSPADEELFAFQFPDEKSKSKSISPNSTGLAEDVQRLGISVSHENSQFLNQPILNTSNGNTEMNDVSHSSPDQTSRSEQSVSVSTVVEDKGLFAGKRFRILLNEESDYERVSDTIRDGGGKIVKNESSPIDYTILPTLHSHSEILELPHFTEQWLLDCMDADKTDIELECYHQPLLEYEAAEKILEGVVLAISSYSVLEKKYIVEVAHFLGAINQDVFSRKGAPKSGFLASTHLLCPSTTTDKYKAAMKWGVPVVKYEWIVACFNARKKLKVNPYIVTEDSLAEDSVMAATPKHNQTAGCSRISSARSLYASTLKSATIASMQNGTSTGRKTPTPVDPVVADLAQAQANAQTPPTPTTPMGPPQSTPFRKKLSLGGSDAEFTPTQSQSEVTPNRSVNRELVPDPVPPVSLADISMGFSPTEIRRLMGVCVLPSPQTPKIVAEIWKEYCAKLAERTPDENEAPGAPILPRLINLPPIDQVNGMIHVENEVFVEPMETSRDEGEMIQQVQRHDANQLLETGEKRKSDTLTDDESNEQMAANKNNSGSRKRQKSDEISPEDVYALFGKPEEPGPKSNPNVSSVSAASRRVSSKSMSGYNPLKVKKVAASASTSSSGSDGKPSVSVSQFSSAFTELGVDIPDTEDVSELESYDFAKSKQDQAESLKNLRRDPTPVEVIPGRQTRSSSALLYQGNPRQASTGIASPARSQSESAAGAVAMEGFGNLPKTVPSMNNEKRLKGQSESLVSLPPKPKPKPSTGLPLVTEGKLAEMSPSSNVGWDLESDPKEQSRRFRRAEAAREKEAEEELIADMEECTTASSASRASKKSSKGSGEKPKQDYIFLLSGFPKSANELDQNKDTILKYIRELGGKEANIYENNVTMLISPVLSKSEKLLCCIAAGKPICHPSYVLDSIDAGKFLPITEKYLWSASDPAKEYEKEIAAGFRVWYDLIGEIPSNTPLYGKNVLLLERDKARNESYKRLIQAAGGILVARADIEMAEIIICDKKELKNLPKSTSVQARQREASFLSDILLKDPKLANGI